MDQLLNVFVTVVEENSFTKAAEKLHMTQPAVSQTIKTIEARLGVQLLERQHKQFHMNQAGEIVYQYAKEILNTYHKMTELVQELEHEPKGALRIGVSYTIGEYFLPAVLSQLVSSYP